MGEYFQIGIINCPWWLVIAGSFIISFILTYLSIPTIVLISKYKKLFDVPNERTAHQSEIPTLGGLALFAGFTISSIVCTALVSTDYIRYMMGSLIILMLLGLKDDILVIDPRKKFIGQVGAAALIVILGDIRLTDFHSVFGIGEVSYGFSVLFSVFFILTLINGYNLIDGVDGLSSGTGIFTGSVAAVWFISTKQYSEAVLSLALVGGLIAFFRFNVFGGKNKIFLGDTGSMITGFVVAVLAIRFIESAGIVSPAYRVNSSPSVALGLLIVPLFDTLRIIIFRLTRLRSPFKADNNHIHHSLLRLGYSHLKITLIIVLINAAIFVFAISLSDINTTLLFFLVLAIATILTLYSDYLKKVIENR
ncbi:MAG: MraY family glycosyltransferase [Bacteroidales bacterium]